MTYIPLLYDRVLQFDFTDKLSGGPLRNSLQQCESKVFEISNVAQYLNYRGLPNVNELYDVFPRFSRFWMEYERPYDLARCGVLWEATRNDAGWKCVTQFLTLIKDEISMLPGTVEFRLSTQGKHEEPAFTVCPPHGCTNESEQHEMQEHEKVMVGEDLTTCFQALAFANLRSECLKIEENQPSRQVRRAAERKGERAPVTYKTLLIRAAKKSNGHGRYEATGQYAWHICMGHQVRSHTKTATAEKPLFGKSYGAGTFSVQTYWVDECERGNPEQGKVIARKRVVEIPTLNA